MSQYYRHEIPTKEQIKNQGNYCLREMTDGSLSSSHSDCRACKWFQECDDIIVKNMRK